MNKLASDCHSNTLCPYKNITVIDREITITTSYDNIAEMHHRVMQTCCNAQQKQFLEFFFFPHLGPSTKFVTAGSQATVIGIKKPVNPPCQHESVSLFFFHLGVTSIICQSCPQIVTKEKEQGSLWSREMCLLVR